jgi:[ribosomal protein S18]-alanine N-acetyltransferase
VEINPVMAVLTRTFRPTDLEEVYQLALDSLQEGYSPNFIIDLYSYWPDGFLVLESRGVLQGFIAGLLMNRLHAKILMLAVRKESRRRGYATMLLRNFLRLCSIQGVRIITLEVRESNVGAVKLYHNLGFETMMKIGNYYIDGETAYKMQLLL